MGSAEHLADIDGLRAVSPDPIATDVGIFRDHLASGAIDSERDPESNVASNWPADVQAAIDVQAFATENC